MTTIKSIEEKARSYDIALDKIKRLLGTGSNCSREELEYVFPELKESEDERIIKAIKSAVLQLTDIYLQEKYGLKQSDCIAWLEKQGEQNLANSAKTCKDEQNPNPCDGCVNRKGCINCENGELREVEQKPADKVETNLLTVERAKEMSPFMRSGFERNPAWSDEDKDILFRTINDLKFLRDTISIDPKYAVNIIDIEREITWLKSLRPQSTWKPSDEQMKALKEACDEHWEPDGLDPLYRFRPAVYTLGTAKEINGGISYGIQNR